MRNPPSLPARAAPGVDALLQRAGASCLEAAMVRQQWLLAHGIAKDIVIGVPRDNFGDAPAHAWVDGLDTVAGGEYLEIHRMTVRDQPSQPV